MELLQLKYFQTVARLEHMTQAAAELGIAQPALSQTIARLEAELAVPLFERVGRGIRLSQFGKVYALRVERIFLELTQGERDIAAIADGTEGEIELAVSVATQLLPDLLSGFRHEHPAIRFRLSQHDVKMAKQLSKGTYDLCITSPPLQQVGVASISLLTEDIRLAVPTWHPLAERPSIHLQEVAQEDFICLKPEHSLRQLTDSFCQQARFRPQIVFESDEPSTIRGLIRAGLGIAFVPSLSWRGAVEPAVVVEIPIERPLCRRTIGLSWFTGRSLSPAAQQFREFAIQYFAQISAG
jgi:LysR family transcriptional regulator, transcription activator of glutamate synthase operon